jgi:S-disulfanyl-L-cysteine oxidoreductase SoxD
MRRESVVAVLVVVALYATTAAKPESARAQGKPASPPPTFGIGRPATAADIAAVDIDVAPDGRGLPPGRGTTSDGAAIYAARCTGCHGKTGREGPNDVLVGRVPRQGFPFSTDPRLPKTIGNYWPYATTLFDYIRRAMPPDAPGSLKDDEVYALVAVLLAWNEIIPNDLVMDAASLPKVHMPARDRFVPDKRTTPRPPAN